MKIKLIIKQLVIIFSSTVLLACATTEEGSEGDAYVAESRRSDCISQGTVRDYRVLDDSNLIVTAAAKRKYHLALSRRAFGLRSTWQIGFKSTTGRICSGFSDIIVDDGFGPERIRITSIRRLTPEEEEDLLVRFGKKDPQHKQAPATEEVEGAEVEELD